MNVILLEPIANLGELGEEVSVRAGFARNFLLPKGKAVRASEENRAVFEGRRAELEAQANERLASAQTRGEALEGTVVTILAKVGEEGKLYGSVGTQDIADALAAAGHEVAKAEVRMPDGVIRMEGEFEIDVQLHSDVTVPITVAVAPE